MNISFRISDLRSQISEISTLSHCFIGNSLKIVNCKLKIATEGSV